jgi:hypothetical protein
MMTATNEGEPMPIGIGTHDVGQLEAAVGVLRALDYRQGGGFCRDAVRVLKTASLLLHWGTVPGLLRSRLLTVLADVHNLVAWTEFDIGRREAARHRFERALELATEAGNDNLVANIHYRIGRLHLHHRSVAEASAQFRLGRAAALRSGSRRALAILVANEAWAFAMDGDEHAALTRLEMARQTFADGGTWPPPQPWEAFFRGPDMAAMQGTVLTELAETVAARHSGHAIPHLAAAAAHYCADMARSHALTLTMLAQNHALRGDVEEAARVGAEAAGLASHVGSARLQDRLAPLERLLHERATDPDVQAVLKKITHYRSQPPH